MVRATAPTQNARFAAVYSAGKLGLIANVLKNCYTREGRSKKPDWLEVTPWAKIYAKPESSIEEDATSLKMAWKIVLKL